MSAKRGRDDISYRISDVHQYDIDVEQRIIYLTGVEDQPDEETNDPGVEYRQTNRFIRNMNILSSLDREKPVLVTLKSPGGYVDEGMSIYDTILSAPMPVTILGYSCVASMASIIFQAANKRVLMPSATFMFHMGQVGGYGTPKQIESLLQIDRVFRDKMIEIYTDVMKSAPEGKARNWSRKRIHDWLVDLMNRKEDVYFTAEETVDWGFADDIFQDWSSLLTYTNEQLARK